jgi:putative transposase
MYLWRRLTVEQREALLRERQATLKPWHSPPHLQSDSRTYLITAACYEHVSVIGASGTRMASFEAELLSVLTEHCEAVYAWVVLPNHYHALVTAGELDSLLEALGQLHGRTSYAWNLEDHRRGRKVWSGVAETGMKSERHFQATVLYVLNNPVRHRYVQKWQDWPYSNAREWLDRTGRETAIRLWQSFPIDDYGRDWDPPDL